MLLVCTQSVRPANKARMPCGAGALGGLLGGAIGVLLPPVMFWGEWEIQTIADGSPLPHIWPKGAPWQGHHRQICINPC